MFTGIVTHLGRVAAIAGTTDRRLTVLSEVDYAYVPLGASVAHSGICLTVVELVDGGHVVEASAETLARTSLGAWGVGTEVNLETSLRLGDELGGHFVFGHVDALGTVHGVKSVGDGHHVRIDTPASIGPMLAEKGSVAVDGVSLTVNAVSAPSAGPAWFEVMVVPYTWEHTTLADLKPGHQVNLEADMLARYVARQTQFLKGSRP